MAELPPSSLIITGGRGRLAGVIRRHLHLANHPVVTVSRSESDEHLSWDSLLTPETLAGADCLLHLAWSTLPATSEKNPGAEWREDLPLLSTLLQALAKCPPAERPHLIFFSSGGTVYGPAQADSASRESDTCRPIGWYGRGKQAAEALIEEFGRREQLAYTILRVSNPYGFSIPHFKPQGIIPFLIESAYDGEPFSVWGDGSACKDYLHHSDFINALERVLERKPHGTFNLAAGESHRITELINLIEQETGKPISWQPGPAYPWDVQESRLDNTKLGQAIDWSPQTSLAEGIARAVADLSAN